MKTSQETSSTISVDWQEPESDGGAPITAYVIAVTAANDTELSKLDTVDGSLLTHTVTDLVPETEYVVGISAENETGKSHDVAKVMARTRSKPSEQNVIFFLKPVKNGVYQVVWQQPLFIDLKKLHFC